MRPSMQIIAAATVLLATVGSNAKPLSEVERALGTMIYEGCFSSSTGLTFNSSYTFNTQGYCQPQCVGAADYTVLGLTNSTDCWCGNELPPPDTLVDNSKCSAPCAGFGQDDCGSADGKFFTVYTTGVTTDIANATDSESTSSSSSVSSSVSTTKTAAPFVTTVGTTVVTVTASAQAASESTGADKKSSKANTAGIIAGVVVGIVAIGAIVGGVFFFLRYRRRQAVEDEYQRNATINNFVANGKPPGSSAGYSNVTDTRLDASALQRRMSDGSIADNEDYSRKILRVTNA